MKRGKELLSFSSLTNVPLQMEKYDLNYSYKLIITEINVKQGLLKD